MPSFAGLFTASGHAMAGLTLGPVAGKLIADCILDGSGWGPLLSAPVPAPQPNQGLFVADTNNI